MNKSTDNIKAALIADIKAKAFDEILTLHKQLQAGEITGPDYDSHTFLITEQTKIEIAKVQEFN